MGTRKVVERETLSRERILGAALRVLDAEGLSGLSMRRLGTELGVEAMSLYNHVPNKAALLDGLFEKVLSELPAPKRSRSYREALRDRAHALRTTLRAHPNALPLFATRPAVTERALTQVELVLDLLTSAGFSMTQALNALGAVVAFVVGHTLACYGPRDADAGRADYARLEQARFPRVLEAAALLPTHDLEQEFSFGLDALLEGLARSRKK